MNSERFVYVKVNRKVAEFIGQSKWHPQMPDGNYLLFISELKRIDRDVMAHREETAAAIGAVLLTDPQAAEEQRGAACRALPEATDPRFRMEPTPQESPEEQPEQEQPEQEEPEQEEATEPAPAPDNSDSSETSDSTETSDNPKELES